MQSMGTAAAGGALTLGAAQSHGEWAVALIQLPETGTACVVSDHRQLLQDQSLAGGKRGAWGLCPLPMFNLTLNEIWKNLSQMSDFHLRFSSLIYEDPHLPQGSKISA